jgi:hypothetical protein
MSKLNILDAWKEGVSKFFAPKSAQGYMQTAFATAGIYASSCGAADDKEKEKPSACGSSCGAGDDKEKENQALAEQTTRNSYVYAVAFGFGDLLKPEAAYIKILNRVYCE